MTAFGRLKESYPPAPGGNGGHVKPVIDADLAAFMLRSVMITAATPGPDRTWIELLFLSCTTMTSTGLSGLFTIEGVVGV